MLPALHLFEYATLRLVPRIEREEFVNAGVILYCRDHRFLECRWLLPEAKLLILTGSAASQLPLTELHSRLAAISHICQGGRGAGPIGALGVAERFRWLTAQRSTIIQCSPVHPGLCAEPIATLEQLFIQLVQ